MWSPTIPGGDGFFWWRANKDADPEPVHVYVAHVTPKTNPYGWTKHARITKRLHDPEAIETDAMGGFWWKAGSSPTPIRLPQEVQDEASPQPTATGKPSGKGKGSSGGVQESNPPAPSMRPMQGAPERPRTPQDPPSPSN